MIALFPKSMTFAAGPVRAGVLWFALAAAMVLINSGGARAGYNYNPGADPLDPNYDPYDFAATVVSSSQLGTGNPSVDPTLYDDPNAVLGRPNAWFTDDNGVNLRSKIIEAPFNTTPAGSNATAIIGPGGWLTLKMGRPVYADPTHPYGVDFIVYGNTAWSGGDAHDTTNLNNYILSSTIISHHATLVSVSQDGVTWYTYASVNYLYPFNAFKWDRASASWATQALNPNLALNPTVYGTVTTGKSAADMLDLYGNAAGGQGYSLAGTGLSWFQYVKIQPTGSSYTVLDAVAAALPVPTQWQPASGNWATTPVGVVWDNGAPSPSVDALIDNAGTVAVSSSVSANNLYVGKLATGNALNVTGGALTIAQNFTVGDAPGSGGSATISAGSVSARQIIVGCGGAGTLNISGTSAAISTGVLTVAANPGSAGAVNLSAGSLTITGSGASIINGSLSIGGAGVLTCAGSGGLAINGSQAHLSGAQLILNAGANVITTDAGSSTPGGQTLTITTANAGTTLDLTVSQHLAGLTVGDGTVVTLAANGTDAAHSQGGRVIVTSNLSLGNVSGGGGGTLDLKNNTLIWKGAGTTGEQQVQSWLSAAYHAGDWLGISGITSTLLQAGNGGDPAKYALAYALADDVSGLVGHTLFNTGEMIGSGDVVVMYTIRGDVSFAGSAGFDSLIAVLNNLDSPANWENGNYHYGVSGTDLNVGFDDLITSLNNLDVGIPAAVGSVSPLGVAPGAVPEPASLLLLACALPLAARRPRRIPSSIERCTKARGFTLIELLVVIAVIALLIGIIVPVLGASREAGKRVNCISNVRQMALAANTYVVEGDGSYPIAHYAPRFTATSNIQYFWDFNKVKTGATVLTVAGLLWSAQGTSKVQQCPSYNGSANSPGDPFTGYNYNTSYIGHGLGEDITAPAKASDVSTPTLTALFGDGQYYNAADKYMRSPFPAPGDAIMGDGLRAAGTQGFRHLGQTCAAFCDAHAEALSQRYTNTSDGPENVGPGTGFLSPDNSAYRP